MRLELSHGHSPLLRGMDGQSYRADSLAAGASLGPYASPPGCSAVLVGVSGAPGVTTSSYQFTPAGTVDSSAGPGGTSYYVLGSQFTLSQNANIVGVTGYFDPSYVQPCTVGLYAASTLVATATASFASSGVGTINFATPYAGVTGVTYTVAQIGGSTTQYGRSQVVIAPGTVGPITGINYVYVTNTSSALPATPPSSTYSSPVVVSPVVTVTNTVTASASWPLGAPTSPLASYSIPLGMTFTVLQSGTITAVWAWVSGANTGAVDVALYSQSGTVLSTGTIASGAPLNRWVSVPLSPTVAVTAGTVYQSAWVNLSTGATSPEYLAATPVATAQFSPGNYYYANGTSLATPPNSAQGGTVPAPITLVTPVTGSFGPATAMMTITAAGTGTVGVTYVSETPFSYGVMPGQKVKLTAITTGTSLSISFATSSRP